MDRPADPRRERRNKAIAGHREGQGARLPTLTIDVLLETEQPAQQPDLIEVVALIAAEQDVEPGPAAPAEAQPIEK